MQLNGGKKIFVGDVSKDRLPGSCILWYRGGVDVLDVAGKVVCLSW